MDEKQSKSQVTEYLGVVEAIYKDAFDSCVTEVSLRDLVTIRSRVKTQGLSFLTITLPNFCRDFERSLVSGVIDSKCFPYFRKHRAIPAFLQGLLSQVFDQETGRINDDVNKLPPLQAIQVVSAVRQICLAFKKIELPCTPSRERKAVEGFVEIESSFNEFKVSSEMYDEFTRTSLVLWGDMLRNISCSMFSPQHGPGATADRLSPNRRCRFPVWYARLEPYFPLLGTALPLTMGALDPEEEFRSVDIVSSGREQPVRVTAVPKTLKGPRIIAIEPGCVQFAQQGIRNVLYDVIESHWWTKGHINFRDQSINQSLAMMASTNGQLATIDLSDASDRVPLILAREMFRSNPELWDAIYACRSKRAELPDGRVIGPLRKFASMGSALCFPIEAMYFYTVCSMALMKDRGLPVSRKSLKLVTPDIFVYGDDTIVPTDSVTTVLDYLRKYNCKVNTNKTFFRGSFRESCGVDAFLGESVTPIYVGTAPPENWQQAAECLSWIENGRAMQKRGYFRTAQLMFDRVESVMGKLPITGDKSPVLGRNDTRHSAHRKRWNADYQAFEVRAWLSSPVYREDVLDGYAALGKCLMRLERQPKKLLPFEKLERARMGKGFPWDDLVSPMDIDHLERSARHGAVANKRRWVPLSLLGA